MRTSAIVVITFFLTACSSSPTAPSTGDGSSSTGDDSSSTPQTVTLTMVQQQIFNTSCVNCHGATSPQAGLDLSGGQSHASLVNVTSPRSGSVFVVPENPDASYLLNKVRGTNIVGDRMPPSGSGLSSNLITLLTNWIQQGALNN